MNQPIKDLITAANSTNCHCQTIVNIAAHKPSLDPSFIPIRDLLQYANHFLKVGHRVEIRAVLSAQFFEYASSHFADANALVESIEDKDDDLYLQLNAVMLVAVMWSSKNQKAA